MNKHALLSTDHLSVSVSLCTQTQPACAFAQCLFLASAASHPQPATSGPRVKSELRSKEFESLSQRRLRRKNPHLNVVLDSQTQRPNLFWLPGVRMRGRDGQGAWEKRVHTTIFKMLTNKVLLCGTCNSAQCYVAAWMEGEFGGECAQPCPTLRHPLDCSPPGSSVHGIFSGKNTGVGFHFLLQGIFPIQD